MTYPFGTAVTIITRIVTGTDGDGDDVRADGDTVMAVAAFDPGLSSEILQGQDQVTTQPAVYLRDTALTVTPYDVIVVNGERYDIDGSPNYLTNPYVGFRGLVIKLKQVTG